MLVPHFDIIHCGLRTCWTGYSETGAGVSNSSSVELAGSAGQRDHFHRTGGLHHVAHSVLRAPASRHRLWCRPSGDRALCASDLSDGLHHERFEILPLTPSNCYTTSILDGFLSTSSFFALKKNKNKNNYNRYRKSEHRFRGISLYFCDIYMPIECPSADGFLHFEKSLQCPELLWHVKHVLRMCLSETRLCFVRREFRWESTIRALNALLVTVLHCPEDGFSMRIRNFCGIDMCIEWMPFCWFVLHCERCFLEANPKLRFDSHIFTALHRSWLYIGCRASPRASAAGQQQQRICSSVRLSFFCSDFGEHVVNSKNCSELSSVNN